jgi:hypothetical protein
MKTKIIISLIFFCISGIKSFSQTNEEPITPSDERYYELYTSCEEDSDPSNCFEFGLDWSDHQDHSKIFTSNIVFYYTPLIKSHCGGPVVYTLTPHNDVWSYADENTKITIKMRMVETAFGYQVSEINIVTKNGGLCKAPPSKRILRP